MDRQLIAFLAVADLGNLTAAAERLHLTQPALTKRLATLEDELGTPLFLRQRRGMELTPAGRVYLRHARRIEQEHRQAREEIGILADAGIETLRIGAGPLFHLRFVAPAFAALRRRFPLLRLDVVAGNNALTLPLLTDGHLDLVLGTLEPLGPELLLSVIPLLDVEQSIALRADHPLAGQPRLAAPDLAGLDWVRYSQAPDSRGLLDTYFARNLLGAPRYIAQTSSFATGISLVREAGLAMQVPFQIGTAGQWDGICLRRVLPALDRSAAGIYIRDSSRGVSAVAAMIGELERLTAAAAG